MRAEAHNMERSAIIESELQDCDYPHNPHSMSFKKRIPNTFESHYGMGNEEDWHNRHLLIF